MKYVLRCKRGWRNAVEMSSGRWPSHSTTTSSQLALSGLTALPASPFQRRKASSQCRTTFGSLRLAVPLKYPDDAIQTLTSSWWVEDKTNAVVRGRLIWTLIPYPELKPFRLVPIGRGDDPRQHVSADFRIESFR